MGRTAFVVDDEENIREIITCALESCGIHVEGFEDAVSMLKKTAETVPDVILLDIMLPEIDGITALKMLKADAKTASVPVIMITAKSSEIDRVNGLDQGADDYIVKPFGILELMARVRAVLRRNSQPIEEKSSYNCSDITLNVESHEVKLSGVSVDLTLKEFELLKLLMENVGKVMPRNELLDSIWGYSYVGETRTLDMHIRSLRFKLGDSGQKYIATVRGIGYKLNA